MNTLTIILIAILTYLLGRGLLYWSHFTRVRKLSRTVYRGSITKGDRSKPPIKIYLHGDSIAAGVGAGSVENSISGRLARHYKPTHYVQIKNQGICGARMRHVAETTPPHEYQDLIILIVSSNDVINFTPYNAFAAFTEKVLKRFSPRARKLIFVGPARMSALPGIPYVQRIAMKKRETRYEQIIAEEAKKYPHVAHLMPYRPLGKLVFAEDQYHPNAEGYKLWFELIKKAL